MGQVTGTKGTDFIVVVEILGEIRIRRISVKINVYFNGRFYLALLLIHL